MFSRGIDMNIYCLLYSEINPDDLENIKAIFSAIIQAESISAAICRFSLELDLMQLNENNSGSLTIEKLSPEDAQDYREQYGDKDTFVNEMEILEK